MLSNIDWDKYPSFISENLQCMQESQQPPSYCIPFHSSTSRGFSILSLTMGPGQLKSQKKTQVGNVSSKDHCLDVA